MAQRAHCGHAYLLTGQAGLGLTEFAYQMAKSLLCEQQDAPCGQCSACVQFEQQTHADFFALKVEEGKKEIGIDQIRQLTSRLMQTAHQGGYKVAFIPQAEQLNHSAFNALLKTLEEPPEKTVLILSAYQPSRLPATIISRCQTLEFYVPNHDVSQAWLSTQMAQIDEKLIKRALRLNWGAPLAALDWLHNQAWLQDQDWQADMQALANGSQTVTQAAQKWLKWPQPEAVFNQFYLMSVNEIRRAFYQQDVALNAKWFGFQQQVLQAKIDWTNNANKELVMENLCLLFLQTIQPHVTLDTIFSSEWIRGAWA